MSKILITLSYILLLSALVGTSYIAITKTQEVESIQSNIASIKSEKESLANKYTVTNEAYTALKKLSLAKFAFLQDTLNAQNKTILALDTFSDNTPTPESKRFFAEMYPILKDMQANNKAWQKIEDELVDTHTVKSKAYDSLQENNYTNQVK